VTGVFASIVVHPLAGLRAAAAEPSLRRGGLTVLGTGLVVLVLEETGAVVGRGGAAAIALSIAAPILLLVFWLVSALLVGAGARLMGWQPNRRDLLAVSGLTFPVLVLYAVIALLQSVSAHLGGDTVATVAGYFALPVICWFVVLNAMAVSAVYRSGAMAAVAIALLPYAAMSGVLMVLVVVLSLLHAAGAV
jgi:hypothetical protein